MGGPTKEDATNYKVAGALLMGKRKKLILDTMRSSLH
jgi:hypothetical protein